MNDFEMKKYFGSVFISFKSLTSFETLFLLPETMRTGI